MLAVPISTSGTKQIGMKQPNTLSEILGDVPFLVLQSRPPASGRKLFGVLSNGGWAKRVSPVHGYADSQVSNLK